MKSIASLTDVIRRSSQLREESSQLKQRAHDTISRSTLVIDQSRELLFSGLVRKRPSQSPPAPRVSTAADQTEQAQGPEAGRSAAESEMTEVANREFDGETVVLDGRHFLNCSLSNCILEYFGGPFLLQSTSFSGCRFRFGGDAALTVAMLQCFGLLEEQGDAAVLPPRPAPNRSSRVN